MRHLLQAFLGSLLAAGICSSSAQAEFNPQYEIRVAFDVGKTVIDYFGSQEKAQLQIYAYLIEVDKVLREQLGARLRIVYEEYHTGSDPYAGAETILDTSVIADQRFSDTVFPSSPYDFIFSFHALEDTGAITTSFVATRCETTRTRTIGVNTSRLFVGGILDEDDDLSDTPRIYYDASVVTVSRDILSSMHRTLTGQVFSSQCGFLVSESAVYCEDAGRLESITGIPDITCGELFEPYLECLIQSPREPFFDPALIPAKRAKLEELSTCGVTKITGGFGSVLPLTSVPDLSQPGDSDGDSVSDAVETSEFTNPNDRGSKREQIRSPIYAPWNGFQSQTNILETLNRGTTEASLRLTIFDLSGNTGETLRYSLEPGEQRDVIVNALQGFSENAYGVIEIEFSGDIDGRVFFYRDDASVPGEFEFAFGIPFLDPVFGPTAVAFNTFQPGLSPQASDDPAVSFLSIINLSSRRQLYRVFKYNQKGELLSIDPVRVGSFGRVDVEAGHQNPGKDFVGLVRILPEDNRAGYISFLNRYGLVLSGPELLDKLRFAFPLIATPGTGEWIHAPVSTTRGGDPWVEIINTSAEPIGVQVQFRNSSGALLQASSEFLPPFAQKHIFGGSIIGTNAHGFVSLKGSSPESLIAQTMFYFRDAEGNMESMYGSQARQALPLTQRGSYNLFLNQDAELTVINPNNSPYNGSITVFDSLNAGIQGPRNISAQGRLTETLRGKPEFSLLADTVGVIQVNPGSTPLIAELLRVRISPTTGRVDYVAPTAVR